MATLTWTVYGEKVGVETHMMYLSRAGKNVIVTTPVWLFHVKRGAAALTFPCRECT